MAGKIHIKATVIIFLCFGIFIFLSACMAPVDMDSFFKNKEVDDYVTNTVNKPATPTTPVPPVETPKVNVDDKTGDGLKGGDGKIEGLKDNRYYMVEKEVDADGSSADGYPMYVTENSKLTPGQLIDDLGFITRISGGRIVNLTNSHTYTVRAATSFFDGLLFTYSDSTGAQNQTVSVENGAITLPAPKGNGNITLVQLNTLFDGYDVMGVVVSPSALPSTSPFYNEALKNISSTETSFQLEGANTEVDYVFVKPDVPANFFVLKVIIGATPPTVIDDKPILGVTVPVAGEVAVTTITNTAQYTGTVEWAPALDNGKFKPSTGYTATITLAAKPGYTLTGVGANFFTVAGATSVTNLADSGVINAVFPATGTMAINIKAIQGVTAPVTGGTPVTTITPTDQYTGTVVWSSGANVPLVGDFGSSTVYKATITLAPKTGYTLTGVTADFFTVAGATATNSANSGVISAVFPATGANPTGNASFTITFNFTDKSSASANNSSTLRRGDFDGGQTVTLTLASPIGGGSWTDIKWSIGGIADSIITSNLSSNSLVLKNTSDFYYILAGSSFDVDVTAVLSGTNEVYSATVPITVTD